MNDTKDQNHRSFGEKSADRKLIELMISEMNVGDILSYEDLTRALGRDVRVYCSGALYSSRRALAKQGVFTDTVINEGIKRLPGSDVAPKLMERSRRRVCKEARRNLSVMAAVEFDKLTEEQKRQHTTAAAQMGAIAHLASSSSRKKIESKVNGSEQLALGSTLKLFVD